MIAEQYSSLPKDAHAVALFVKEKQVLATQMMQVGFCLISYILVLTLLQQGEMFDSWVKSRKSEKTRQNAEIGRERRKR